MSEDEFPPPAEHTTTISSRFSPDLDIPLDILLEIIHLYDNPSYLRSEAAEFFKPPQPFHPLRWNSPNGTPLSTFSDIPLEMIMEIVPWIDTPSLLNCAKVNRILNRLSLEEYWKRECISPKTLSFHNLNWPNKSKEVLGSFSIALFLEKVESIYCRFGSNVSHLWDQIYAMTLFLQNIDSIGKFEIFFDWSSVEDFTSDSSCDRVERGEYWYTVFVTVLDLLFDKGCTRLKISEPRSLQIPLQKHIEMGPNPAEQLKSNFKRKWGKLTQSESWQYMVENWWSGELERMKKTPSSPLFDWISNYGPDIHSSNSNLTRPSTSTLQELEISSRMMFFPLLYLKTLDIMKVHGSTLHTLVFNRMALNRVGWKELFDQVYFPVLESFTIVSNVVIPDWEYSFATFDLLTDFLTRHETTIITLQLHTIFMLYSIPINQGPRMSKLKRLVAQPLIISSLLKNPKHCSMLESICILAEYPSNLASLKQDDDIREYGAYDRFDEALQSISGLSQNINLEIDYKVEEGLKDWLMKHISGLNIDTTTTLDMDFLNVNTSNRNGTISRLGGQSSKTRIKPSPRATVTTVMEGLKNVKRLDILAISHDTYSMVGITGFVVSWVMLFPALQKLVFGFEFGTRIIENYKELCKFEPVVEERKRTY